MMDDLGLLGSRIKSPIVYVVLLITLLLSVAFTVAVAQPEGPSTMTVESSTRRISYQTSTSLAEAGNVSHMTLRGETVTQTWHGFVGNISGTITLDDGSNYTLYNWSLTDPEGEVYATYLSNISWTTGNLKCWNWSIGTGSYLQLGELEGYAAVSTVPGVAYGFWNLSLASDDIDGVNETFSCGICDDRPEGAITAAETHTSFYVGGQLIDGVSRTTELTGACPVVRLFNSTGSGTFEEVILYHDVPGTDNDGIVYASIINLSADGYNSRNWDFEMIVGENGHNGNTSTTDYYFYVEIE